MRIDASLATRLVATQFPHWADLPITPVEVDGWDNRTFRLGFDMSVRLPRAAPYAEQVEKERLWLPALAPHLPLPIPSPLAKGVPGEGYAWDWSVYRWIDGELAGIERIDDLTEFATTLAQFLAALQRIDATDGPPPGQHNFYRAASLQTYDGGTRRAIATLGDRIPRDAATQAWETALLSTWYGAPVWFHGDVAATNLLVSDGRLSAVIDFGCCGVGDPACDMVIAWTFLSGASRDAFRTTLAVDDATWARGRGWALWKALITMAQHIDTKPSEAETARRVVDAVLADHARSHRG